LAVAGRVLERFLNADTSDYAGPVAPCPCGGVAHYLGRREKTFVTVLGPLRLRRAYYHCTGCGQGFFPRDRQLGMEHTSLSPGVTRMVGLVGAMTSFAEGSTLLSDLAGLDLGGKRVERAARSLGDQIAVAERTVVEPELGRSVPHTLYLGMDGTGIPMRAAALEGRTGKQADGSARTREVKLCVVWSAEHRDAHGVPVRDPGSATYSAAIESAATRDTDDHLSAFAERVARETTRRRFELARRRAVLGDGAAWIWNLANEQCPGAVEIVDRFHAKQHLSELAGSLWGEYKELRAHWLQGRYAELDLGNIETLTERIGIHAEHFDEARRAIPYFTQNEARMRYGAFREAGFCTSTGIVEGGCKTVVGTRFKRPGMHWSVYGANAILALRCAVLSNRLDPHLARRLPSDRIAA